MVLMDIENRCLHIKAFQQPKRKARIDASHARHMTGQEMLDSLARGEWDDKMQEVFREGKDIFKKQRRSITEHEQAEIQAC
jgi:hypothetical protein